MSKKREYKNNYNAAEGKTRINQVNYFKRAGEKIIFKIIIIFQCGKKCNHYNISGEKKTRDFYFQVDHVDFGTRFFQQNNTKLQHNLHIVARHFEVLIDASNYIVNVWSIHLFERLKFDIFVDCFLLEI